MIIQIIIWLKYNLDILIFYPMLIIWFTFTCLILDIGIYVIYEVLLIILVSILLFIIMFIICEKLDTWLLHVIKQIKK